jgi:hypothetical protein
MYVPLALTRADILLISESPGIRHCRTIEAGDLANIHVAYEEEDDGFTFARKTRSKKATDAPVAVEKAQPSPAKPRAAPRNATRSDSKTDSRAALTSSDTDGTRHKRRSARLSGDKEEVVQILPTAQPKRKRKSNELKSSNANRSGSPELPQPELQIEKKRDGTKIALPFADTPVINRNKEMRAMKSKAPNRRSSVNSRGRRASSLIESGTSNGRSTRARVKRTYGKSTLKSTQKLTTFSSFLSDASSRPNSSHSQPSSSSLSQALAVAFPITPKKQVVLSSAPSPCTSTAREEDLAEQLLDITNNFGDSALPHSDVSTADFYKHIEHSLLEPKRMRQLLTWSATRALPPKQHDSTRDANEAFTLEAARSIVEDLLKDFSNKAEMSSWFEREGDVEAEKIVKKPNPRNSQNAERLRRLEEDIKRLKQEEKEWNELTKTPKSEVGDGNSEDIDLEALDPEQAAILAELRPEVDSEAVKAKKRRKSKAKDEAQSHGLENIASRMRAVNSSLEPQIDLFADGIHKMGQYRLAAERVADAVLGTTAKKLEIREKAAQEATGTSAVGAKEVLFALAGALNGRGEGR